MVELGETRCSETSSCYGVNLRRTMHNLISHSQLDGWQHNHYKSEDDMLDDYYECLIECDTQHNECKRICREILQ